MPFARRTSRLTTPLIAVVVVVTAMVTSLSPANPVAAGEERSATPADGGFIDVPDGHPFETEIVWALDEGVTTGYPGPYFRPSDAVTRQSAAAFLYRYAGSPNGEDPTCSAAPFADVPTTHPFCGEIKWLVDEGISSGYPGNTFRPSDPVTRQSAAAFLYRYAGSPNGEDPTCSAAPFTDIATTHPFCGEIDWMVDQAITAGYAEDDTFRPTSAVTRQSMVAFLYRYDGSRPLTGVSNVSMSRFGACASVSATFTVRCWGLNSSGQIGDGTYDNTLTPKTVQGVSNSTNVFNGTYHACANGVGGAIKCWGTNSVGQLGIGSLTPSSSPLPLDLPGLTGVGQISGNDYHACAVLSDATVKCWGSNADGQLGLGSTSATPVTSPTTVPGLTGVSKVVTGRYHTCALLTAGSVKCWGTNDHGQVGDGTTTLRTSPVSVSIANVVDIAAAWNHTCAVRSNGSVRCWGSNDRYESRGESGADVLSPLAIPGVSTADKVAVGNSHSCVRLAAGTLTCWGDNWSGEMGQGFAGAYSGPIAVPGLTNIASIAAAQNQVCVIVTGGAVLCWGDNNLGQLGDGTAVNRYSPTPVHRGH